VADRHDGRPGAVRGHTLHRQGLHDGLGQARHVRQAPCPLEDPRHDRRSATRAAPLRGRWLHEAPAVTWLGKPHYKQLTDQGSAHEMKRYAARRGSQVDRVSYEVIVAVHGMICHLCKLPIMTRADLQMDHVIPLARGGSHTYGNIRPSHGLCNRRKHAKLMSELAITGAE
jgi:5-methylcytosine-specific restriction endonuclease McrA